MKKHSELAIVINPNSTRSRQVGPRLLDPLISAGIQLDIVRTNSPKYDENVKSIQEHLEHTGATRVIVASGDGVSSQTYNSVLQANREMELGFWAAGGLCDLATASNGAGQIDPLLLAQDGAPIHHLSPLEVSTDTGHVRFAPGYVSAGWTAAAVKHFDDKSFAQNHCELPQARTMQIALSLGKACMEYLRYLPDPSRLYLPSFRIDHDKGSIKYDQVTDFFAINIANMARIVKNPDWDSTPDRFNTTLLSTLNPMSMSQFALCALMGRASESVTQRTLHFADPSDIRVQTEGEHLDLTNVHSLTVAKRPDVSVPIVMPKAA